MVVAEAVSIADVLQLVDMTVVESEAVAVTGGVGVVDGSAVV